MRYRFLAVLVALVAACGSSGSDPTSVPASDSAAVAAAPALLSDIAVCLTDGRSLAFEAQVQNLAAFPVLDPGPTWVVDARPVQSFRRDIEAAKARGDAEEVDRLRQVFAEKYPAHWYSYHAVYQTTVNGRVITLYAEGLIDATTCEVTSVGWLN